MGSRSSVVGAVTEGWEDRGGGGGMQAAPNGEVEEGGVPESCVFDVERCAMRADVDVDVRAGVGRTGAGAERIMKASGCVRLSAFSVGGAVDADADDIVLGLGVCLLAGGFPEDVVNDWDVTFVKDTFAAATGVFELDATADVVFFELDDAGAFKVEVEVDAGADDAGFVGFAALTAFEVEAGVETSATVDAGFPVPVLDLLTFVFPAFSPLPVSSFSFLP